MTYELGRQRLMCGDCLELLPSLSDGCVDMVFCDLPYAHMSGGKVRKCTANKWDRPIDLAALWEQLLRVGKRNAAFVFTATFDFAVALRNSQPKMRCYDLIWHKNWPTGYLQANKQPLRSHETILAFLLPNATYNPQKVPGKPYTVSRKNDAANEKNYGNGTRTPTVNLGNRHPCSVLSIPRSRAEGGKRHPTQKPVALIEWLIRTYSKFGDTVLDPTMGSGTTLVACQNTGRRGIGIEKDATYYATAQRRLAEHQPLLPDPAALAGSPAT